MADPITTGRAMLGFTHTRTNDRGVTLIELLLALVLFAIGAAALAGGMRSAVRSAAMGSAWSSGALAVESRFEVLRSKCTLSAGVASSGAVDESWTIVGAAGTMLPAFEVLDSVRLTMSTGVSRQAVRSIVRCVP